MNDRVYYRAVVEVKKEIPVEMIRSSWTCAFAPTDLGTLNVDVTITDDAPDSPRMVPITGIGVGGKVHPE